MEEYVMNTAAALRDKESHVVKMIPGIEAAPHNLARALNARVLLESASFEDGRARYSLLMADEAFRLIQREDGVYLALNGGSDEQRRTEYTDILQALHAIAGRYAPPHQSFPFPAGGIGYFGYEYAARCDAIRLQERPDPLDMPEAQFLFGHRFVIFDHKSGLLYLIGINYREHEIDLEGAMDELEERIASLPPGAGTHIDDGAVQGPQRRGAESGQGPDISDRGGGEQERRAFVQRVQEIREEIIAGNLLQAVLSRRVECEGGPGALEAYARLRRSDPSPYHFYLDFGDCQLFGASPEVHVSVKEGTVTVKPIAGTRPRGATRDEDRELEAELREDPKERAEHLMLVDLARNDLGRISVPGSVEVHRFMQVERFARVMHLVTEVTGRLREGLEPGAPLRATFPAGTVSGAPKIRAIETLDRLEPHRRGFYAGAICYVEPGGNMDSCITIRSALKKNGTFVLQAGAGIVYDSVPEREYEETEAKLSALAGAVGLEERR